MTDLVHSFRSSVNAASAIRPTRMEGMVPSFVRMFWAILPITAMLGLQACRKTPEIILVVDTEMSIPAELDHIVISIAGPTEASDPIALDLSDPATPPFPLTLGLTQEGAASPVTIDVAGAINGNPPDVKTQVRTGFVDGDPHMLRIVLSAACLGVVCMANETCSLGKCVSPDRTGESLPAWSGAAPARPDDRVGPQSLWAGGWRTCASKGETLYCWGENSSGQLGNGFVSPDSDAAVPTRLPVVGLPKPAQSVGTGFKHGCVCDTAGQVWCWGDNSEGQLGTGNTQASLLPVKVAGLTECSQVAGGGHHTCAVCGNGHLFCWGQNNQGQVGIPVVTSSPLVLTPQSIPAPVGVIEVRTGDAYTCARKTNNTVQCWGDNSAGQLGDAGASRSTPSTISLPTGNVVGLASGRLFACVVMASGQVWCWGENTFSMLGSAPGAKGVPVQIVGISDAKQITAGHQHACVLRETKTVSCWGNGANNLLGDFTPVPGQSVSKVPVEIGGIANVTSVQAGVMHTCARNDAGVFCWGQNINGQLGIGSTGPQSGPPVHVIGL